MIIVAIFLTASTVIVAVAGIVASGARLTDWWRRHNAEVTRLADPDIPHRTDSRFAAELARLAADLAAGQPETPRPFALPVSGRADRDVVDRAAVAAHGADETRPLQLPPPPVAEHRGRHAAPERDDVLEQLAASGWPRTQLRSNAFRHKGS
ncbi:hypothetical protein [Virgisporangium ochraceum]|uniref:Uncharacterized protein n=1 Tax=Virgisporangium ochraceum TaxID=65505 RepID=A0A8J3ZRQ1_9ACTN|nr:hypothetical protein [Virgisporangium ochraceum]GIJ66276.1 hypothetical protein Voc01_011930 [Virgisporangium ochraceum]